MKIVVITGEESGDKLAASAIKELRKISNEPLKIFGIGGRALEKEGIQKFFDISEINVMGLIEVIPKIFKINRIIKSVVNQIIELDPDIIFTVDSPDFTLRIAERIKKRNNKLKILHYVAPSVWAWRPGRVHTVKKSVDHLLTILPFEKKIFEKYEVPTTFVGHPITEINIENFKKNQITEGDREVFLILPGSRKKEVVSLLPIYLEVIRAMKLDDKYELVMPLTKEMTFYVEDILSEFGLQNRIKIILDEHIKYSYYYHAKLGIVTSGTAALEVSYFNTPYVTAYKFNPVTYFILHFLIKTRMGNLINIIQGKFIIPELLQSKSNKDNIMYYLKKFLDDNDYLQEVLSNASEATAKLKSQSTPSIMAAEKIIQIVNEK